MLTHKVKHQMKTEPLKRELAKPLPKGQPSNKGNPSYPSKPVTSPTSFPQEDHAPQNSHPPQDEPSPNLITPRSCFECQDLEHIALECPNGNITSLAECEDNKEEEENLEVCMMEEQDEVVENVDEEQEEEMEESMVEEPQQEEVVYAKEGDMLELKTLLSIQKHTFSPYLETPTTLVPLPPHQIAKSHAFEPNKEGGISLSLIHPTPKAEPNDSIVFNDSNLKPYFVDDKLENLRANSFLEGENDGSVGSLLGPIKNDSSQQESKAKNWLVKAPRAVGKAEAAPGLLFVFDRGKGQL